MSDPRYTANVARQAEMANYERIYTNTRKWCPWPGCHHVACDPRETKCDNHRLAAQCPKHCHIDADAELAAAFGPVQYVQRWGEAS